MKERGDTKSLGESKTTMIKRSRNLHANSVGSKVVLGHARKKDMEEHIEK